MTNALRLAGVTLPGAGYPKKKNFVVPDFPVKTGLVGLYVIGGTESLSLVNHANAVQPLLKIGAPVVNDLGASTSKTNCFETQILGVGDVTFIAVGKPVLPATQADGYLLVSNYKNVGVATGDSLGFNTGPIFAGFGGVTSGASIGSASIATGDVSKWNSFAGRVRSTGATKAWWSNSGAVAASGESAGAARAVQARPFRIGGHHETVNSNFSGTSEVQMVAIFAAALSDVEVAQNLAYLTATYGPAIGLNTL